jgi:hypothetical protein
MIGEGNEKTLTNDFVLNVSGGPSETAAHYII